MFDRIRVWRNRNKPMMILDFESYGFDPADLKPGPICYVQEVEEAPDSLADMIDTAGWFTRLSDPSLFRSGAKKIRELKALAEKRKKNLNATHERLRATEADNRKANDRIRAVEAQEQKAREANSDLVSRAALVIGEMNKFKSGGKGEEPFAVVISPYQLARLTLHGAFAPGKELRRPDLPSLHTISGVPIYVASGVYGPVVLTEDAFNGMTRMAPELLLKSA